ncbi:MAG: hypothetical protein U0822_17935 [Anaerolineae bacterium]
MTTSTDFYGLPTRALDNGKLRVEFLTQDGPRIVRLFVGGSNLNLLAEMPEMKAATPDGDYFFRGGHRLWHSPEAMPRTYIPDHVGFRVEDLAHGVRLLQPTEVSTGIRKTTELRLTPDAPSLTLNHTLTNDGLWPVELAPWAITQLRLGGWVALPQTIGPLDGAGLLPNRQLVLWPYTRINDPRFYPDDRVSVIQAQAEVPPFKIGYMNRRGWAAYAIDNVLFIKHFTPQPENPHADFGCNNEVYCNDQFVELETLGPLVRLEPGQSTYHQEIWDVRTGLPPIESADDVRRLVEEAISG